MFKWSNTFKKLVCENFFLLPLMPFLCCPCTQTGVKQFTVAPPPQLHVASFIVISLILLQYWSSRLEHFFHHFTWRVTLRFHSEIDDRKLSEFCSPSRIYGAVLASFSSLFWVFQQTLPLYFYSHHSHSISRTRVHQFFFFSKNWPAPKYR